VKRQVASPRVAPGSHPAVEESIRYSGGAQRTAVPSSGQRLIAEKPAVYSGMGERVLPRATGAAPHTTVENPTVYYEPVERLAPAAARPRRLSATELQGGGRK